MKKYFQYLFFGTVVLSATGVSAQNSSVLVSNKSINLLGTNTKKQTIRVLLPGEKVLPPDVEQQEFEKLYSQELLTTLVEHGQITVKQFKDYVTKSYKDFPLVTLRHNLPDKKTLPPIHTLDVKALKKMYPNGTKEKESDQTTKLTEFFKNSQELFKTGKDQKEKETEQKATQDSVHLEKISARVKESIQKNIPIYKYVYDESLMDDEEYDIVTDMFTQSLLQDPTADALGTFLPSQSQDQEENSKIHLQWRKEFAKKYNRDFFEQRQPVDDIAPSKFKNIDAKIALDKKRIKVWIMPVVQKNFIIDDPDPAMRFRRIRMTLAYKRVEKSSNPKRKKELIMHTDSPFVRMDDCPYKILEDGSLDESLPCKPMTGNRYYSLASLDQPRKNYEQRKMLQQDAYYTAFAATAIASLGTWVGVEAMVDTILVARFGIVTSGPTAPLMVTSSVFNSGGALIESDLIAQAGLASDLIAQVGLAVNGSKVPMLINSSAVNRAAIVSGFRFAMAIPPSDIVWNAGMSQVDKMPHTTPQLGFLKYFMEISDFQQMRDQQFRQMLFRYLFSRYSDDWTTKQSMMIKDDDIYLTKFKIMLLKTIGKNYKRHDEICENCWVACTPKKDIQEYIATVSGPMKVAPPDQFDVCDF